MTDVLFKDEDVTFKDEDVLFDEHLLHTLVIADCANEQYADSLDLLQEQSLVVSNSDNIQTADAPDLVQEHLAVVSDSEHIQNADAPALEQEYVLIVSDTYHVQAVDAPDLISEQLLVLTDGVQENVTEEINLGGTLSPDSCTQSNFVDTVALSQEYTLSLSDAANSQYADVPSLTPETGIGADAAWQDTTDTVWTDTTDTTWYPKSLYTLDIDDNVQANVADVPALIGEAVLVVLDAANEQVADALSLLQEHNALGAVDGVQNNVADALDLIQEHYTAASDTAQIQNADAPALEQEQWLALDDTVQNNVADTPSIGVEGGEETALAVQDAAQINVADGAAVLVQEYVLGVSDTAQNNVTDAVTLGFEGLLVVDAGAQAQTVETPDLQQSQTLVLSDAVQINSGESLGDFAQTQIIVANDAVDEQYAEAPVISELAADSVSVESAVQANVADALVLLQEHILVNSDCAQLQSAESFDLVVWRLLGVTDCTQYNMVDVLTLYAGLGLGVIVDPYIISLTVDRTMQSVTPNRYLIQ